MSESTATPTVALVTGASRGIGAAIALELAARGHQVIGTATTDEGAARITQALAAYPGCRGANLNVNDAAAVDALIDSIVKGQGGLHVLVNNAGIAPRERRDVLEATEESFEELIKVNLQGPYFLTQAAARWMVAQKKADAAWAGAIINVSSISATVVSVSRGEYCVSKAGVSMATQLWAARLGEFDIPVYEVRPGVTATDMTAGVKEKYDKLIADGLCVTRRWGVPDDVGKAVAALARGDFPYSTGQVIMVDGGLTMPRL